MKKELGIFLLLALLCAVGAYNEEWGFRRAYNIQNLERDVGIYGIFAIAMGVVIITGGIDLSTGSVFAIQGVILSLLVVGKGWAVVPGVLVSIAVATGLGLLHGGLITRLKIQPFLVTLCGMMIYRSLARWLTDDKSAGFSHIDGTSVNLGWLEQLTNGKCKWFDYGWLPESVQKGIPWPFILLIFIAIAMYVLLHRSIYGRYLFAIGRNEDAARYSGIRSRLVIASAYGLTGLLTGIAGVLMAVKIKSVSPSSHGVGDELLAIAAAVLGGCSLRGGEGSVLGIIFGTAVLQVLQRLVNLAGIPTSLNFAVIGTVIFIGVLVDQIVKTRKQPGMRK